LIIINKPSGMTSFAAVATVRKLTGEKRVGHCGTLDPLASGVLPIFIGRPCALQQYLSDGTKEYTATLKLGITTDSYDITGNILSKTAVNITKEDFLRSLKVFKGEIMQTPPMFSAKSVDGVHLYKLARAGKTVDVKPCKINIFKLELLNFEGDTAQICVGCSKGTYIRSLVHDIGEDLGCGAVMTELVRTKSAGFDIENAHPLDTLDFSNIEKAVISEEKALMGFGECFVSYKQAVRFYNGGALDLCRIKDINGGEGEKIKVKQGDVFVGLGEISGDKLKSVCPINEPQDNDSPKALALGTFDGLHKGHQKVIESAVQEGLFPCAVTFAAPPKQQNGLNLLLSPEEKTSRLKKMGIKQIISLDFNKVKDISAQDFLQMLKGYGNIKKICCGFNYRFGSGAMGDISLLSDFCARENIELFIAQKEELCGTTVSSSAIREYIQNGDMPSAKNMLGCNFYIKGKIIHGDGRGRRLGFATLNLRYGKELVLPKNGVYATLCEVDGKEYPAITNIGHRPTYYSEDITCETHIPNFSGDIYGKTAKLSFVKYLREERKFESADDLSGQIKEDITQMGKIFIKG
ncbi:MAG: bifunctional riboflavin kinase/FAD synthetase, partial [Oscillospiraceae bacterium]|nr:bifunctional riboflavin kinase/FAD synthetase [Candidatus Equicaccousia limihippi]